MHACLQGGACERFDPPLSPWCSGDFYLLRQFPEMHTRSPAGLSAGSLLPNIARYDAALAGTAAVHAWRPGHWYTWMFEVAEYGEGKRVDNWTTYENVNAISGQVPSPGQSTATVKYLGQFTSQQGCDAKCKGYNEGGATCHAWTWHEKTVAWRLATGCS